MSSFLISSGLPPWLDESVAATLSRGFDFLGLAVFLLGLSALLTVAAIVVLTPGLVRPSRLLRGVRPRGEKREV